MLKVNKSLCLLLLIFAYSSCTTDDLSSTYTDSLSKELENSINGKSQGKGLAFFTQPESDDFNRIPQDPNNPLSSAKVELGKFLFHEPGIGNDPKISAGKYTYSCASCHHVSAGFQAGRKQGIGEGGVGFGLNGESRFMHPDYDEETCDVQSIKSPSTLNVAYQTNMLWNGQFGATGVNIGTQNLWYGSEALTTNELGFEGVETQAIAGLKVHRMSIDPVDLKAYEKYIDLFAKAFQNQPNTLSRENAGLAIAAYERTLLANQSPFQNWLKGDENALTDNQKKGAILFFDKANCVSCHTGPALNSMAFYGLGMNDLSGDDVFDVTLEDKEHLGRGGFTQNPEDNYKFKVPQLYNLSDSPFYGHGGNFESIREVIEYKNNAVAQNPSVPESQLAANFKPLNLTNDEIDQLVDFIENGLNDPNLNRYVPNNLASEMCFPNNDFQSKIDLGCN